MQGAEIHTHLHAEYEDNSVREPGRTSLYVGLPSACGSMDGDCMFSLFSWEGSLVGDCD